MAERFFDTHHMRLAWRYIPTNASQPKNNIFNFLLFFKNWEIISLPYTFQHEIYLHPRRAINLRCNSRRHFRLFSVLSFVLSAPPNLSIIVSCLFRSQFRFRRLFTKWELQKMKQQIFKVKKRVWDIPTELLSGIISSEVMRFLILSFLGVIATTVLMSPVLQVTTHLGRTSSVRNYWSDPILSYLAEDIFIPCVNFCIWIGIVQLWRFLDFLSVLGKLWWTQTEHLRLLWHLKR